MYVASSNPITYTTKIIPYEEKVLVFKMYLTPAELFNDFSLEIVVNGKVYKGDSEPLHGKSDLSNEPKITQISLESGYNVDFLNHSTVGRYRFGSRGSCLDHHFILCYVPVINFF